MNLSSLTELTQQHLDLAGRASSGRSAHTVYGGQTRTLRQTLIALTAGQQLDDHQNPGEATIHVLHGRVRLVTGDTSLEGGTGDLLTVPDSRHRLEALDDAVVLLTVAKLR
jgi:quercetin dioxygenase-like cupin family protein